MLKIMEQKIIVLVEFTFHIVAYWGRFIFCIFKCAWGCRKQKPNFLHLILSTTLPHWRCTFIFFEFSIFFPFNLRTSFNKVTLYRSIIKILFKIFSTSIAHFKQENKIPEESNEKEQLLSTSDFNFLSNNAKGLQSSKKRLKFFQFFQNKISSKRCFYKKHIL